MKCAWDLLIKILPIWMRQDVDRLGKETLQELRLRLDMPPELCCGSTSVMLDRQVTRDDLSYCINTASRYSPWKAVTSAMGYVTAPGGHRIGICGETAIHNGQIQGIRTVRSLCIRVARDFPGCANGLPMRGSVLILGRPGSGKTTLLRDLIRLRAEQKRGSVAVIDEREELYPVDGNETVVFPASGVDVLTGCPKAKGVDMVLRSMGPTSIAVDEITAKEDCQALIQAGWCGVDLLASAHAGSIKDLYQRPVYKPLVEAGLFETVVVMQADKSWKLERMERWI